VAEVMSTGTRTQMGQIGQALGQIDRAPSALQTMTRRLVRVFAVAGVALSVLVAVVYVLVRGDWLGAVLAGITLAMSMLPQEFPLILTVFMAMGAWRISQQRVLVRRASAIEALGTATVLCTDKTGTLTQNRMTVAELHADGLTWLADAPTLPEHFHALLEFGILASQRDPFDPMEKAFWDLGARCLTDADREHLHPDWQLGREYALSPDLLAMSHGWIQPDRSQHVIAAKGAPEAVADLCHLDEPALAEVRRVVEAMASRGLRVLGVARARLDGLAPGADWPAIQHDFDFEFLGLVGLVDPLRASVPQSVARCRQAGIRVAMITGDYPATALAIAAQAGLDTAGGVLTGSEISTLSDEALRARVRQTSVYARVMPEQKWRIVRAYQAVGEVVAMTGDGVNDAPSLKAADIGVAMGSRGTDVAREASAIVLLDDDFSAIAQAVRLGRRIDDNLRKAMAFVLAVHVPIAGLSLLPLLMGWPLLFMPVHIAFLELIIDPVCSVVFEAEPEEAGIMRRPPRQPGTSLLSRPLMLWSLGQGALMLVLVAGWYAWLPYQGVGEAMARTGGFIALVSANVALIISNRSFDNQLWASLMRPNRSLWLMLAATVSLLMLVLVWPTLTHLFQFAWPAPWVLIGSLSLGVLTLLFLEMLKRVRRGC
jgi:Ca2+-transporting ATPase